MLIETKRNQEFLKGSVTSKFGIAVAAVPSPETGFWPDSWGILASLPPQRRW